MHDAAEGRAHDAAVELGLGRGERGLGGRNCASRLTSSSFGQLPVTISLRLASSSVRRWISSDFGLRHLRLARIVGEHSDDVALLDPRCRGVPATP